MALSNPFARPVQKAKMVKSGVSLITRNGASDEEMIRAILSPLNPKSLKNFMLYLTETYAAENLLCYIAMQECNRAATAPRMHYILKTFVGEKAAQEANLPIEISRPLEARLDSDVAAVGVFTQALNQLMSNLMDSFSRYNSYDSHYGRLAGTLGPGVTVFEVCHGDPAGIDTVRTTLREMRGYGINIPGGLNGI